MDFIAGLTDDELRTLAERLRPFLRDSVPITPTNSPAGEEDHTDSGGPAIMRAIVTANDRQLIALTEATTQMIQQSTQQVYDIITTEINEKIVPQINRLAAHAQYTYMDEPEFTTMYRRAAVQKEQQSRGNTGLITDGVSSDRVISQFAQKVFGEDD
jgi:hypothetical protein